MANLDSLDGLSNPVRLSLREVLADTTPVTIERLSRQLAIRWLEPGTGGDVVVEWLRTALVNIHFLCSGKTTSSGSTENGSRWAREFNSSRSGPCARSASNDRGLIAVV